MEHDQQDAREAKDEVTIGPDGRTVYSAEFKMAKAAEFIKGGGSRAEFSGREGLAPSAFDGWHWKYEGFKRGTIRNGVPAAAAVPAPIDVTSAVRGTVGKKLYPVKWTNFTAENLKRGQSETMNPV